MQAAVTFSAAGKTMLSTESVCKSFLYTKDRSKTEKAVTEEVVEAGTVTALKRHLDQYLNE